MKPSCLAATATEVSDGENTSFTSFFIFFVSMITPHTLSSRWQLTDNWGWGPGGGIWGRRVNGVPAKYQ